MALANKAELNQWVPEHPSCYVITKIKPFGTPGDDDAPLGMSYKERMDGSKVEVLPYYAQTNDGVRSTIPGIHIWGGKKPPPDIGDHVDPVRFGEAGKVSSGTVIGYFSEYGWLGVVIQRDPGEHINGSAIGLNFGVDFEEKT